MGQIVRRNQPCEKCGSSDAKQGYEDGTAYCFSCTSYFKNYKGKDIEFKVNKELETLDDILEYDTRGFKERGITRKVAEYFGVKVSYNTSGEIDAHYYPYGVEETVGYKKRKLPKEFTVIGKLSGLFGQKQAGNGNRSIVITEGELDAMAIAQAWIDRYDKIFPVVSIPSASQTKVLLEQREWLRSFETVVLWFDMDDPGKAAVEKAARIIGYDKVKVVKNVKVKDANDLYLAEGASAIINHVLNAQAWSPVGIVSGEEIWEQLAKYQELASTPYPPCLEGLNSKLKGMRQGEITLFTSGTSQGKSSVMREIILHLVNTTEDKIGVVALEESPAETARKLSAMALCKNPVEYEIGLEELRTGFDQVFINDRLLLLDHQGSLSDGSIEELLEYMCLAGCKYIFIDHITMLVSEGIDNLTGNEAVDKVMNDLLRLVKRHSVWIGLISHLRKSVNSSKSYETGEMPDLDSIKGSGSIKQIAMDVVAFTRNSVAENENERNKMRMRVLKCRYTGLTGDVEGSYYDRKTGRLKYIRDYEDFELLL